MKISLETKEKLLSLARLSIKAHLKRENTSEINFSDSLIEEKRGVFVTLKYKNTLRGCIGTIEPIYELKSAISNMAVSAAFEDPRFTPLTLQELEKVEIEISVLTLPKKIVDPYKIRLGVDGVIVSKNGRKGVFLPQVATETGWKLEEFMNHLCRDKAGIKIDEWKTNEVEIKIFQVESFSEHDFR